MRTTLRSGREMWRGSETSRPSTSANASSTPCLEDVICRAVECNHGPASRSGDLHEFVQERRLADAAWPVHEKNHRATSAVSAFWKQQAFLLTADEPGPAGQRKPIRKPPMVNVFRSPEDEFYPWRDACHPRNDGGRQLTTVQRKMAKRGSTPMSVAFRTSGGRNAGPGLRTGCLWAQTVDEVVDRCVTAAGGRAALGKVTSRSMSGTITLSTPAGDITGTVELLNAVPNKSRSLIKADLSALGAGQLVMDQRFDGKRVTCWTTSRGIATSQAINWTT